MLSIFFIFEAYLIVVFIIEPFITSPKTFGFVSTLLVAVSIIVFLFVPDTHFVRGDYLF